MRDVGELKELQGCGVPSFSFPSHRRFSKGPIHPSFPVCHSQGLATTVLTARWGDGQRRLGLVRVSFFRVVERR